MLRYLGENKMITLFLEKEDFLQLLQKLRIIEEKDTLDKKNANQILYRGKLIGYYWYLYEKLIDDFFHSDIFFVYYEKVIPMKMKIIKKILSYDNAEKWVSSDKIGDNFSEITYDGSIYNYVGDCGKKQIMLSDDWLRAEGYDYEINENEYTELIGEGCLIGNRVYIPTESYTFKTWEFNRLNILIVLKEDVKEESILYLDDVLLNREYWRIFKVLPTKDMKVIRVGEIKDIINTPFEEFIKQILLKR